MEPAHWTTSADGAAVLRTVGETLASQGYTLTPDESGWGGRAEVGSKAARALAGGFARRMILDYAVTQGAEPGTTLLRISPASTGWSGGALGASKAQKEMASVVNGVHEALVQQGLVVSTAAPGAPPGPTQP